MQDINLDTISIDTIDIPLVKEKAVYMDMLRLDKIHPLISGNKWFKLRYYLEEAVQLKKTIVTYGGAWSNHILAAAAACRLKGLKSIGIIRGEEPLVPSAILEQAAAMGMRLVFLNREDFAKGKIPAELKNNDHYFIPQGGYGKMGAKGAAGMLDHAGKNKYTDICCAAGTGTMMAGLILASSSQRVTGISVLKNNYQLEDDTRALTGITNGSHPLLHAYHFGGYAKYDQTLIGFMNNWYAQTGIPTDFVYTGKLCYAVNDLLQKDFFKAGSRILLIHSGGLAGNLSLKKGTLIF